MAEPRRIRRGTGAGFKPALRIVREDDLTGDRELDGLVRRLARVNTEAARLRNGKRYVDMTDEEKTAYNAAVFAL